MDHLREALRRLLHVTQDRPSGDVERRREVASRIARNPDYLYQIAAGVKLRSGKTRTVGRELRAELDLAYPGWLEPDNRAAAQAAAPPHPGLDIAAALEAISRALAREMPDTVREDVADALSKLAIRHGADHDQQQVLHLLNAAPAKLQRYG